MLKASPVKGSKIEKFCAYMNRDKRKTRKRLVLSFGSWTISGPR